MLSWPLHKPEIVARIFSKPIKSSAARCLILRRELCKGSTRFARTPRHNSVARHNSTTRGSKERRHVLEPVLPCDQCCRNPRSQFRLLPPPATPARVADYALHYK